MFVFVATFVLYLATLFPGVAPYRDTGEMTVLAATLGVAHPPGYPLYTLLARAFSVLLPVGDIGYRLNVLSALGGALTAWLLYRVLVRLAVPRAAAAGAALLLATSYLQWYLSLVSEMYTLNTLCAVLLVLVALAPPPRPGGLYLLAFLFGLGLGIRMDLVLIGPFVAAAAWSWRADVRVRHYPVAAAFFVLGLSGFIYLLVRSHAGPLLDWGHPATLERFWGAVTRRSHGGTLDLISAGYAAGENYATSLVFHVRHLMAGTGYVGILLALLGLARLWRRERLLAIGSLVSWAVAGPVFMYKANMPPNPHALAILEAHFLLPNLFVFLWCGVGLAALGDLLSRWSAAVGRYAPPVVAAVLVGVNLWGNLPELNKRGNFVAYDYARSVLRSLPPGAVVVAKKDVQLFALWHQQLACGRRPDLAIVAQGLAGAAWYRDSWGRRLNALLTPLKTTEDWRVFRMLNGGRALFVTGDAEYERPPGTPETPAGLVTRIGVDEGPARARVLMDEVYPLRGPFRCPAYREFFTPDLIEDLARAQVRLGQYLFAAGDLSASRKHFSAALRCQPLLPLAENYVGFTYFNAGACRTAREHFQRAAEGYAEIERLAVRYRSGPRVIEGARQDHAEALNALGVCAERCGDQQAALASYDQAVRCSPGTTRARFNKAVVLWNQGRWREVMAELEGVLRIDPDNREAVGYYARARANAARSAR